MIYDFITQLWLFWHGIHSQIYWGDVSGQRSYSCKVCGAKRGKVQALSHHN